MNLFYSESVSCPLMRNIFISEAMKGLGSASKHQRFKKDDVVDFINATLDDDSDSISLISEASSSLVSVQSSNNLDNDLTLSSTRTRQAKSSVVSKIEQEHDDSGGKKTRRSESKKSVISSKQSVNKRTANNDISADSMELLEKKSRTEPRLRGARITSEPASNAKSSARSANKLKNDRKVQPVLIKKISDSDYVSFRNDTPDSIRRRAKRGLRTAFERVSENNNGASPRLGSATPLRKSRAAAHNAK